MAVSLNPFDRLISSFGQVSFCIHLFLLNQFGLFVAAFDFDLTRTVRSFGLEIRVPRWLVCELLFDYFDYVETSIEHFHIDCCAVSRIAPVRLDAIL